MSPFWVPLAAAASFSSSPCLFMCVSIPPQVTPCCKLPRIVSRAPERDGQRLGRGLSSRQHVSAHTQAVFHHRVAGGQRQPLARVSLRGSYPAGGAQLCQFQPDEPFSQRLPLHWQGGLLQPGLGLCRGRLAPSEPGRAGPSRAPSSRLGRPPAACFALHAPALRLAAKGPLHLLPVANTPLPVSGPQVPRYVQLFSSLLSSPASSGGPRPVPAVRMLGVGGRPLPGAEGSARLGRARGLLSLSPPPPNLEELSEPSGLGLVLFCCFSRLVLVSREEGGKREGKAGWDFVSFLPPFKADEKVDIFCSGVLRAREEPPKEAARRAGNGGVLRLRFPRGSGGARRAAGPQEAPAAAPSPALPLFEGKERREPQRKEEGSVCGELIPAPEQRGEMGLRRTAGQGRSRPRGQRGAPNAKRLITS